VMVSYDIANDKRRSKIARTMEDYGTRVQYSVFEVNLKPSQVDKMRAERLLQDVRTMPRTMPCARFCEMASPGRSAI